MKNYSNQDLIQFINQAPPLIQERISNINTALEIAVIGKSKKLHIDQIGKLAELNRNMLLGLIGPDEFLKELVASGVSDADVKQIMTEINQKIFVPLREQMRSGAGNTQPIKSAEPMRPAMPMPSETAFRSPTPANPQLPQRTQQVNASVPRYTPPAPPIPTPQHFHLENKIPPRPAVAFSEGGPPTPPSSPSGLAFALKQVLHEGGQTSLTAKPSEKLLEDHEEPHIEVSSKVQVASSSGIIPPGVRFSPIAHEVQPSPVIPKVEPQIPPAPVKPIPPTPPITKSYVDDPYREPIDTP